MKRLSLCLSAFAIVIALASLAPRPAAAETSVSIGVNVGNAPPPAIVWRREPRLVIVPGSSVYCYDGDLDYDYFEYGTSFYIFSHDRWYRAPSWRGPFVYIREDYVPRAFYGIGDRGYRWRHGWGAMPPGQYRRAEVHERNADRREMRRDVRGDERRDDRREKKHKDKNKDHGGGDNHD